MILLISTGGVIPEGEKPVGISPGEFAVYVPPVESGVVLPLEALVFFGSLDPNQIQEGEANRLAKNILRIKSAYVGPGGTGGEPAQAGSEFPGIMVIVK